MATSITALRGPIISCKCKPNSSSVNGNLDYEPDGLILLEEGKIIDFGPAIKLIDNIPVNTKINVFDECRIIKTTIQ